MSTRTLVVNADDLALHPAINEGVFEAHEAGVLRSASMIATGAWADEVVRYVRGHPSLDIGIHLTLLDVTPAGDPGPWRDCLDENGLLPPSALRRSLARLLPRLTRHPAATIAEFDAQIRRVLDLGLRPTHLDSHNHLHLWPTLFAPVAQLCVDHGIRWIRLPRAPIRRWPRRPWEVDWPVLKGTVIRSLGRVAAHGLQPGLRTPDHFVGLGLYGPGAGPARVVQLARALDPGITEWLVHPVRATPTFRAAYPWGSDWGREHGTLCDPAVRDTIAGAGVRLASFGELA